jgi:hypothetical protein
MAREEAGYSPSKTFSLRPILQLRPSADSPVIWFSNTFEDNSRFAAQRPAKAEGSAKESDDSNPDETKHKYRANDVFRKIGRPSLHLQVLSLPE